MKKSRSKIDISVVMPCLNEEKTVGKCIRWAKEGLLKLGEVKSEIIIVDNGSCDHSKEIAKRFGAHVLDCPEKGYGRAYKKGLDYARGKYIIIADSDGTYDLREIQYFVKRLREGYELVLGSRFQRKRNRKSMPLLHRIVGNPLLTLIINIFHRCRISDSQTGLRAFTRAAYLKMNLKSGGMEFASEMIIKAIAYKLKIMEISISYYPRFGVSKLSPIKDTWRIIISTLFYSPTYVLVLPGIVAFVFGIIGTAVLVSGPLYILGNNKYLDVHTMTACLFLSLIGLHVILIGIYSRLYMVKRLGITGGFITNLLLRNISLEKLFFTGLVFIILALGIIFDITLGWIHSGFAELSREREFIVALGLGSMGGLLASSSFLIELMQKDV